MLPTLTIRSDGVLEALAAKLGDTPAWMPAIYATHMPLLGESAVDVMHTLIEPNRYTGALQESITSEYDADPWEPRVVISPKAQRGAWDAGALLELGVPHPMPNAPWAPIRAWADFRGLPAYPIWWSIRAHGIKAHPFLQRTLDDFRTQTAMIGAITDILNDMAIELAATGGAGASLTFGSVA